MNKELSGFTDMQEYDVIIIGSGLGGLVCANILSKEGWRVLVLEKNKQFGGNLQTFARNRCIFDTGVHYIGGLLPHQNLYRYFKYLGIADKLRIERMDMDAFDVISFDGDDTTYPYAQGYDNFIEQLSKQFPDERLGIQRYIDMLKQACHGYPLYNLRNAPPEHDIGEFLHITVHDAIKRCTDNPKLQAVLAGSNLLYAGYKDKTPFYVHALSVNSYIESAWRCIGGGSQIAKLLIREIRKAGGEVLKRQEVTAFHYDDKLVSSVTTKDGKTYRGRTFISNVDPKTTLKLIGDFPIRRTYSNRIRNAEDTTSSFSLYIVFDKRMVPYANQNFYHFQNEQSVWQSIHDEPQDWPTGFMASMSPDNKEPQWADSMSVLTYMDYSEVAPWADTRNTVAAEQERGISYEQFKARKAQTILSVLEKRFPGINNHIKATYTATPLTYRDYIGSETGSMYGFVKDVKQPLQNYLPSRTKIKNLLLTGQGVNMHGILGVTISAVMTCSELLGTNYLIEKIREANKL